MIVSVIPFAQRRMVKLKRRYPDLPKLIDDVVGLYLKNPRSSKLKLHKLNDQNDYWSMSLKYDLRLVFIYERDEITIVNIGSHDEVYR